MGNGSRRVITRVVTVIRINQILTNIDAVVLGTVTNQLAMIGNIVALVQTDMATVTATIGTVMKVAAATKLINTMMKNMTGISMD